MKLTIALAAIPLLGMLTTPGFADWGRYDGYHQQRFEQRLDRQHRRIKQGVRSGELTPKEARKLRKQQRRIDGLERRFSSDGHLDRRERRVLRKQLDRASDRIYRFKHNDRYRYGDLDRQVVYEPRGFGQRSFVFNLWEYL